MMSLINFFKKLFKKDKIPQNTEEVEPTDPKDTLYKEEMPQETVEKHILSIWDSIKCNEHTQAYHLVSVIPFDEWIDMDEIRRRIYDLFQIEYKNDRSLYPYLKTMVDLGLIETSNIGGKRKWRKKDLLIKLEEEAKKEEIPVSLPISPQTTQK
jgi:hypothetical protein